MFNIGPIEMAMFLIIGVLLFGKRLPEVGRSLGKGILEFKRGLNDIKAELDLATEPTPAPRPARAIEDYEEPTAPRFEPPAREPFEAHSGDLTEPRSAELHSGELHGGEPHSGELVEPHRGESI